ncbi:hypothetical protein [Candidatus Protofrankia californiensis]|uniref:hypothetical protein n=1 Tax=Candidatus Protofrankia californiensis TaxID=1839754 RepID=UPI0010419FC0|nr:hypothetical protein [Candidatus Protofrankia californiensis]
MEEVIEGCFKLFFAIVFFLCAPVIALYYLFLGIRWLLKEIAMWWATNGTHVMVGLAVIVAAVVLVFIVSIAARHWWELHQAKSQRRRALRRLDRRYQQTVKRMNEVGRPPPSGGGQLTAVPKK